MIPEDLDTLDRGIIAALQVDGRRAYSRIADEVGVSESVIRYRVRRLEDAGILQIVGVADPLRIGYDLMALVGCRVTPGQVPQVIAQLRRLPEASYLVATAGRFDVFVEVMCRDTAHFSEVLTGGIQTVDGLTDTETFLVLGIHKMTFGWGTGDAGDGRPAAHPGPTTTD
jgi:Lrp/AsnC family transcriptional regulator for asnA, asnC and gidA